jgi:hypothetical protein
MFYSQAEEISLRWENKPKDFGFFKVTIMQEETD